MTYKMKVIIADPDTKQGMMSDMLLIIDCSFVYDEEQYGNGHYVSLRNRNLPFGKEVIDIRYDTTFDRNNKAAWLEKWARNYWTGNNGAWEIKSLEIEKVVE